MTRDERGRFKAGGGSGNPSGRPKDETGKLLRDALSRIMTKDDADEIIVTLVKQAKRGDAKAREHLFAMAGIDIKSVTVKGDSDQPVKVVVEYVRVSRPAY